MTSKSRVDLLRAVNRLSKNPDFQELMAWWADERKETENFLKFFEGISLTRKQGECIRLDALIDLVTESKKYDGGM